MTNNLYWIWFQLVFGMGTRRAELFLHYFQHPQDLYGDLEAKGTGLGMLDARESGVWEKALEQAETVRRQTLAKDCAIVTPDDPQYPPMLQNIYSKPAVLYVRGDIACLQENPVIAMVGTRKHSEYGKRAAQALAGELAGFGAVVVSGLAKGIDTFCHEAALAAGGKSVGILGCGLDVDYPKGSFPLKKQLRHNGAVVTEYPMGTRPIGSNFPFRNRILSGVSHGVVVVEADLHSGSMITANYANEQGRDVFAVPGSIFSLRQHGAHRLIQDGCHLVESAADILEVCGFRDGSKTLDAMHNWEENATTSTDEGTLDFPLPEEEPVKNVPLPENLSPEGETVLAMLDRQPVDMDTLINQSEWQISTLHSTLTELELYGLIKVYPGRKFARM